MKDLDETSTEQKAAPRKKADLADVAKKLEEESKAEESTENVTSRNASRHPELAKEKHPQNEKPSENVTSRDASLKRPQTEEKIEKQTEEKTEKKKKEKTEEKPKSKKEKTEE